MAKPGDDECVSNYRKQFVRASAASGQSARGTPSMFPSLGDKLPVPQDRSAEA